jgi:hypothetical protein
MQHCATLLKGKNHRKSTNEDSLSLDSAEVERVFYPEIEKLRLEFFPDATMHWSKTTTTSTRTTRATARKTRTTRTRA